MSRGGLVGGVSLRSVEHQNRPRLLQRLARAIQASKIDETTPSRSVLNCWRPRGVPILMDLPTFRGRSYESVDSQERSEGHERFTTNFLDGV